MADIIARSRSNPIFLCQPLPHSATIEDFPTGEIHWDNDAELQKWLEETEPTTVRATAKTDPAIELLRMEARLPVSAYWLTGIE